MAGRNEFRTLMEEYIAFLEESVERAKEYLSGALADMLDLGNGSGPMTHGFDLKEEYRKVKA